MHIFLLNNIINAFLASRALIGHQTCHVSYNNSTLIDFHYCFCQPSWKNDLYFNVQLIYDEFLLRHARTTQETYTHIHTL